MFLLSTMIVDQLTLILKLKTQNGFYWMQICYVVRFRDRYNTYTGVASS